MLRWPARWHAAASALAVVAAAVTALTAPSAPATAAAQPYRWEAVGNAYG